MENSGSCLDPLTGYRIMPVTTSNNMFHAFLFCKYLACILAWCLSVAINCSKVENMVEWLGPNHPMNMERVKPWLHHQNAWCTLCCNAEKVFNYIWEISLDEQHWFYKVSEEIWNKQDKTLYLQLMCARAVLWVTQLLPNHQGLTVRQDHRSNMAWPMQEFWNAFQHGLFCTLQYSQQFSSECQRVEAIFLNGIQSRLEFSN